VTRDWNALLLKYNSSHNASINCEKKSAPRRALSKFHDEFVTSLLQLISALSCNFSTQPSRWVLQIYSCSWFKISNFKAFGELIAKYSQSIRGASIQFHRLKTWNYCAKNMNLWRHFFKTNWSEIWATKNGDKKLPVVVKCRHDDAQSMANRVNGVRFPMGGPFSKHVNM